MPLFDAVWVDALVQASLLTPYQASEINAGRGERLLVGPFVIQRRLQRLGYADWFVATNVETKKVVHLVVASTDKRGQATAPSPQPFPARGEGAGNGNTAAPRGYPASSGTRATQSEISALQTLVERFVDVKLPEVVRLESVGVADDAIWAAYAPLVGFPVSDWLACQGRLPPTAVLEIARQTAEALATLEAAGIVHGDLAASSLWLTEAGEVQLARCGVRPIIRPVENATGCKQSPEMLDGLSPERWSLPTTIASDLYAFGCLCWHLLAGRPLFAGGNFELKRREILQAKIPDLRSIAPDVSGALADIIERCLRQKPKDRPQSFAEVVAAIGPSTTAGRRPLVATLLKSGRSTLRFNWPAEARRALGQIARPSLAAAACVLLLAAATYPLWKSRQPPYDWAIVNQTVSSSPLAPSAASGATAGFPSVGIHNSTSSDKNSAATNPDQTVHLANYETAAEAKTSSRTRQTASTVPSVIELPGKSETAGATVRLLPGALIRGKNDERPRIVVPANGLIVPTDKVRFENIDFIWHQRAEEIVLPDRHAIVDLRATHVQFIGCTFQAISAGTFELPVAIRVSGSGQQTNTLTPATQIQLERCVVQGVAAGIDCRTRGPVAIAAQNTLYLGSGPWVRFSTTRATDASAKIEMENATIRGARSVVELNCDDAAEGLAPLTITTNGCVFVPDAEGALIVFRGSHSPPSAGGLLKSVEWSGQGSLITPDTSVVLWQHADLLEPLPEAELSVDGLATSVLEFEGLATSDPANSRLRRWLGPIRSEQSPGIGENLPQVPALNVPQ